MMTRMTLPSFANGMTLFSRERFRHEFDDGGGDFDFAEFDIGPAVLFGLGLHDVDGVGVPELGQRLLQGDVAHPLGFLELVGADDPAFDEDVGPIADSVWPWGIGSGGTSPLLSTRSPPTRIPGPGRSKGDPVGTVWSNEAAVSVGAGRSFRNRKTSDAGFSVQSYAPRMRGMTDCDTVHVTTARASASGATREDRGVARRNRSRRLQSRTRAKLRLVVLQVNI